MLIAAVLVAALLVSILFVIHFAIVLSLQESAHFYQQTHAFLEARLQHSNVSIDFNTSSANNSKEELNEFDYLQPLGRTASDARYQISKHASLIRVSMFVVDVVCCLLLMLLFSVVVAAVVVVLCC